MEWVNPLVPRVPKIKIRNLALNRLVIVEFVKKMGFLYASETNGQSWAISVFLIVFNTKK